MRDLGNPPVLALTATATPRVRQDILVSLKMRSPEVVVTSFNRPNLTYRVIPAKEKQKHKLPRILDVIRATPPPGIVYATTRKERGTRRRPAPFRGRRRRLSRRDGLG